MCLMFGVLGVLMCLIFDLSHVDVSHLDVFYVDVSHVDVSHVDMSHVCNSYLMRVRLLVCVHVQHMCIRFSLFLSLSSLRHFFSRPLTPSPLLPPSSLSLSERSKSVYNGIISALLAVASARCRY